MKATVTLDESIPVIGTVFTELSPTQTLLTIFHKGYNAQLSRLSHESFALHGGSNITGEFNTHNLTTVEIEDASGYLNDVAFLAVTNPRQVQLLLFKNGTLPHVSLPPPPVETTESATPPSTAPVTPAPVKVKKSKPKASKPKTPKVVKITKPKTPIITVTSSSAEFI